MSFSLDISRFVEATKLHIDVVYRKIALDVFTRIILRSPVDTGRFRGNWQLGIGTLPTGVLELDDKTGTATVSKITAQILGVKAGQEIGLVNNLPYALPLEHGWSKQAPVGMVKVTVAEFQAMVDKAVAQGRVA